MKALFRNMIRLTLVALAASTVALSLTQCKDEIIPWDPNSIDMVISEYVEYEDSIFSDFSKVLEVTGINSLLSVRGPFTMFLPTNDAMDMYYESKGVTSLDQIDVDVLKEMVYNHLFQGEITSNTIGQGALMNKNALEDYVSSDFTGIDIVLNQSSIIVKRDVYTANGVVHHIDKVIEPIHVSVLDRLEADGGYSIFLEGLYQTGIADTLDIVEFQFGLGSARNRYTVLAIPDTVFERNNIQSVTDLIDKYGSEGVAMDDRENEFFQFMEYHCLNGTYFFNEFSTTTYQIISFDNYLSMAVGKDYKINRVGEDYTGFYYELSNMPAKNGVIHTINDLLPVEDSEPVSIIFQTTDYFDLQQGAYYLNYYQRFYDGENSFEKIKWDAEFMLYYLKPDHNLMDDDCINLNGHFWVEITTRKIRKGSYDLSGFFFFGGGHAVMSCYVDGEYLGKVDLSEETWGGPPLSFGRVHFDETKEHTIRLETINPGSCFWDYVKFKPL